MTDRVNLVALRGRGQGEGMIEAAKAALGASAGESSAEDGFAVWFALCGLSWWVLGWSWLASSASRPDIARRVVAGCMLVLALAGIVLIPASGFWLMLPLAFVPFVPARASRSGGPHEEAGR